MVQVVTAKRCGRGERATIAGPLESSSSQDTTAKGKTGAPVKSGAPRWGDNLRGYAAPMFARDESRRVRTTGRVQIAPVRSDRSTLGVGSPGARPSAMRAVRLGPCNT